MTFGELNRRLNIVARLVVAQEWLIDGAVDEALAVLRDLERELVDALDHDNEQRCAA